MIGEDFRTMHRSSISRRLGTALLFGASAMAAFAGRVLEVTGTVGATVSTSLVVPASASKLWLRTHGVVAPGMASVQVNSGPWIPLSNEHCSMEGIGAKLNGIGGPLDTLSFTVSEVVLNPGVRNTFTFRFNGSDSTETAFRVLDLNFKNADGQLLLAMSDPVQPYVSVIPSVRSPSYSQAAVEAQKVLGQQLWTGGSLLASWNGSGIRAKCSDCHAADGRDLKYFNYSSRSIQERAKFHGIDAAGATAIAVYIESHATARVGSPWNPPYQPKAGLDSLPIGNWAAGGGISAVSSNETATFNALFGGGTPSFNFAATINARELPVQIPLPDWNTWLPKIHPLDYWGDSFLPVDSAFKALRTTPKELFQVQMATAWGIYQGWAANHLIPMGGDTEDSATFQVARYSLAKWRLVRTWDALQTMNLEDSGKYMFPWPESAARTWPGTAGTAFQAAPQLAMSRLVEHSLRDSTSLTFSIRSLQWYWLQLVLNDANHRRNESSPIDWPYLMGQIFHLWGHELNSEAMLITVMAKSAEAGTSDPFNPLNAYHGFIGGPRLGWIFGLPQALWSSYDPAFRDSVISAFVEESSNWTTFFGRNHFINVTGEIDPLDNDNTPGVPTAPPWIRSHAGVISLAESLGYSDAVIQQLKDFGAQLWPDATW
jgi:hypothetical protein